MSKTRSRSYEEAPTSTNRNENTSKVTNNKQFRPQTRRWTFNGATECHTRVKHNSNSKTKNDISKKTLEKQKKSKSTSLKNEKTRASKTKVGYFTRFGNKEKLRNSKMRLFAVTQTSAWQSAKRFKKNEDTIYRIHYEIPANKNVTVLSRVSCRKRTIEQASDNDDLGLDEVKRRKTDHESLTLNSNACVSNDDSEQSEDNFELEENYVFWTSDFEFDDDDFDSDASLGDTCAGFDCDGNADANPFENVRNEHVACVKAQLVESLEKKDVEINANTKVPLASAEFSKESDDDGAEFFGDGDWNEMIFDEIKADFACDDNADASPFENVRIEHVASVKAPLNESIKKKDAEINASTKVPLAPGGVEFVDDGVQNESILLDFCDDQLVPENRAHRRAITSELADTSSLNEKNNNSRLIPYVLIPSIESIKSSFPEVWRASREKIERISRNDTAKPVSASESNTGTNFTSKRVILDREKCRPPASEDNAAKEFMFKALGLLPTDQVNQKRKEMETKATKRKKHLTALRAINKRGTGCKRMKRKPKKYFDCNQESLKKENILSFYSKTIGSHNLVKSPNTSSLSNTSNIAGNSNDKDSATEPLSIDTEVHAFDSIQNANLVDQDFNHFVNNKKNKIKVKPLIVPEKSLSLSVHSGQSCLDVCGYCGGKFASLDVPCHIAQLKHSERQKQILNWEPDLKMDTCLCLRCFKSASRIFNRSPIKRNKKMRRSFGQHKLCAVQNCNQIVRHYGTRKRSLKNETKIANISFEGTRKGSPTSFRLCSYHFLRIDSYTVCGLCRKRLKRNAMYSIKSDLNNLNGTLKKDDIPVTLNANMLLCKYCHNCISLRLNYSNTSNMPTSKKKYYLSFRKEILRLRKMATNDENDTNSSEGQKYECGYTSDSKKLQCEQEEPASESPTPTNASVKKNPYVGLPDIASLLKSLQSGHSNDKNSTRIRLKFGNLNIDELSKLNIGQNALARSEPKNQESTDSGENQPPLTADLSYENDEPSETREACVSTTQFDKGMKKLWQDLQKPYGNQSSFIRHLIMLEKHWRSGALKLSENADPNIVKDIKGGNNRIIESLEMSSSTNTTSKWVQSSSSLQNHRQALPALPIFHSAPTVCSQPPTAFSNSQPHSSPSLKVTNVSAPFRVRKAPICTVKPSSDIGAQTRSLLLPPFIEKSTSVSCLSASNIVVSLEDYRETMKARPCSKPLTQVVDSGDSGDFNTPVSLLSVLREQAASENAAPVRPASTLTVNFPAKQFASPLLQPNGNSMILARLSKASFIMQVDKATTTTTANTQLGLAPPPLITSPCSVAGGPPFSKGSLTSNGTE